MDGRRWGWPGVWVDLTDLLPEATNAEIDLKATDLVIGHTIMREWKGEEHRVYVVEPVPPATATAAAKRRKWWRYVYRGERYKTLSAIARKVTGDPTFSGNRFFRLRRRRRGVK